MKSQKGITMYSLIIYVASFLLIAGLVGNITTYFFNNMRVIDTNVGTSAEYNKFNIYMLNQTKQEGTTAKIKGDDKDNITFFQKDGEKNTFVKKGKILYYNTTKLCSDVEEFKVEIDTSTGKDVVKVLFTVEGTAFSTEYVLK